jgi:uncharacterized surface protein with fasciclin (FAS1) repeats
MNDLRKIIALLTLSAIVHGTPVEQSTKNIMGALADTKDTSIPASFMKTAGLDSMTTPGGKYTLFVASDTALKAMSPDTKNQVMKKLKDKQMGKEFLRGHMIDGLVTPDEMTDGRTLTLMNGMTMKVGRTDGRLTVDDAAIVKVVKTGNGMIYVMDRIPSSIEAMMEQMGMLPASSMTASG